MDENLLSEIDLMLRSKDFEAKWLYETDSPYHT